MMKIGNENAMIASAMMARSIHVPTIQAARMPSGNAIATAKIIVTDASAKVGSMRWPTRSMTGSRVNSEMPRSPCSSRPSHSANW